MSIYYRAYSDASDAYATGLDANYNTARASTVASQTSVTDGFVCNQTSYNCSQIFLVFNTSTIPSTGTASFSWTTAFTNTNGNADVLRFREVTSVANKIAGASLSTVGTLHADPGIFPTTLGRFSAPILSLAAVPATSSFKVVVYAYKEELGTVPTTTGRTSITLADTTGTTSDPYLEVSGGTPWSFVGVSAIGTPVTATPIVLTEPAGVADGDLLIACIASRTTATTAITGTGWTAVGSQNNNNTLTTTSALASGTMLYRIRSGTPTLSFTLPATVSVAMGQIVAYRGHATTTPLDASTAVTTPTNTLAVSVTGLTTTQDDDLIVAMAAGGQEASWSAFNNATTPIGASGATDTTTAPSTTAWIERADTISGAGADTSLGIFDAVRTSTGATGNLTVTAQQGAGHVIIAGAFRLYRATADAWNDNDRSANITLSNSDKKATVTTVTAAGVRSTTTYTNGTAGKYYAEFVMGSTLPNRVGLSPTSNVLDATTLTAAVAAGGSVVINNVSDVAVLGAFVAGDVASMAWDAGAERIWFRRNANSWNATGADPGGGTGGLDCSFAAATPHALWGRFTSSTTNSVTVRTELAEYTQSVPSGFSSWMGETPAGGGVTVAATGVAAGTALGTVVVDAVAPVSFEAVGVAATTALGTATATGKTNISTVATGAAAVTALGAVTVSTVWNVAATSAGVAAGTALGTATATAVGSASVTPTGQSAATALGNVSVAAGGAVNVIPGSVTAVALTGTATVSVGVNVTVTPTGVSAAAVTSTGATAPSSSLIASFTPGPNRNDFTGEVGVRWGIGAADIPITWMGMYVTTTGGSRTVRLYEWFGDTVLRTVVFDFTGKTPGTWVWQPITPITLVAGGYYSALHSVTASDGLAWADALAPGAVTSVAGIVNTYATYRAGGAQTAYAPDIEYVGLDLGSGASGAGGVVVTIASTVQAAGAAASTALGTATVNAVRIASTTAPGQTAATALGNVSVAAGGAVSVTPAGVTAVAALGTATVTAKQAASTTPAGVAATALTGSVGVAGAAITTPIGQVAATALSSVTVTAKQAVTTAASGVTAGTALGGVSIAVGGGISITPSSVTAAAVSGTATVTAKQQVSTSALGVTAAALSGTAGVSVRTSTAATGVAAGTAVGTATVTAKQAITVTTTGVTASTALGGISIAVGGGISITAAGQSAAAVVGTATVTAKRVVSVAATGVAAATADGVVVATGKTSATPVGQFVTAYAGTVTVTTRQSTSISATGVSMRAEVGSAIVTVGGTGLISMWDGHAWVQKPAWAWSGSAWIPKPVKTWNGIAWI